MKKVSYEKVEANHSQRILEERIEDDRIIIDGRRNFPRKVVFFFEDEEIEYDIIRTRNKKFQMS